MLSLLAPLTARTAFEQDTVVQETTAAADQLSVALQLGTLVGGASRSWSCRAPLAGRVQFEVGVAGRARLVVLSDSGELLAGQEGAWSLAARLEASEGEVLVLRLENRERHAVTFASSVVLQPLK